MKADRTILSMRYAQIINEISIVAGIDHFAAIDKFYTSPLFPLIDNGIADLHCRSAKYLAEEILSDEK